MIPYIISNVLAVAVLMLAWQWPKVARVLFALLFAGACFFNWQTALYAPQLYLAYADMALLDSYKQFILGWFSSHAQLFVFVIAGCQGFIAIALLTKGGLYKAGCLGAILFLLAIMPLGIGSAFPSSFFAAVAMALLFQNQHNWLWKPEKLDHPTSFLLSIK